MLECIFDALERENHSVLLEKTQTLVDSHVVGIIDFPVISFLLTFGFLLGQKSIGLHDLIIQGKH